MTIDEAERKIGAVLAELEANGYKVNGLTLSIIEVTRVSDNGNRYIKCADIDAEAPSSYIWKV